MDAGVNQKPEPIHDHQLWVFLTVLHGVASIAERGRLIASALPSFVPCLVSGVAFADCRSRDWRGICQRSGATLGESETDQVIRELQPVIQQAFDDPPVSRLSVDDSRRWRHLAGLGVRALLIAPMTTARSRLGALFIGTGTDEAPSRSTSERMTIIAEHAAIAFENLRLRQQLSETAAHLEASADKYRSLYDHTPVMMHEIDEDGRLIRVNNRWLETLGYDAEEVIGQPAPDFMTDASARRARAESIPRVFAEGAVTDIEYQFVRKNGEVAEALLSAVSQWDPAADENHALAFWIDVTEKKLAEQRAAERTRDLEAFSYSVSHDLRAPLRAISGFSRILLEDHAPKLDDEAVRLLHVIRRNTESMGELIDGLLAFSRLGRQGMTYTNVDLGEIAASIVEEFLPQATDRKLEIRVSSLPVVRGDRRMLRQVMFNLVSNAVKFTAPRNPAVVEIGASSDGARWSCFVRDNGVGFDPQYIDKLFGVFQRLHRSDEFEGTGVGLALVKRIISRHKGVVWAEGEVGKGACIHFALPRVDQPS